MFIKKMMQAAILGGVFIGATNASAQSDTETKDLLLQLQRENKEIKNKLNALEVSNKENIQKVVQNEVARLNKGSNRLLTLKKSTGLTIGGDLRYRYQAQGKHADNKTKSTRQRARVRMRLGMNWKTTDGWDIGLRLVTGDSRDARSTNYTYGGDGSGFGESPTSFDLTYVKRKWELDNGADFTVTLGQQLAPWRKKIDSMFTNGDINPAGLTFAYEKDDLFFKAGGYTVAQIDSGKGSRGAQDIMMFVLEGGYDSKTTQAVLGYWHFNDQIRTASAGGSLGAGGTDDAKGDITDDNFGFDILRGRLSHTIKTEAANFTLHGDAAYNLSATEGGQFEGNSSVPGKNALAWVIGAKVKSGRYALEYKYAHVEGNSLPWFMVEPNFNGGTTNGTGHSIAAKMQVTDNCHIRMRAFLSKSIVDRGSDPIENNVFQFDLNYKF